MKLRYVIALLALFALPFNASAQINAFPSYTENFEASNGGWTASGTNNTWNCGVPSAAPYNSSPAGTRVWKTNLTGNYNNSEQSFVTSPLLDFTCYGSDPTLSFYLVYFMESGYDYMNIQISTDAGATWNTLGTLTSGGTNWYNVTSSAIGASWGGGAGPAGSQTWKLASHVLTGTAGKNNVMIRFRFYSDSSVAYAGPAFDLISISLPGGGGVPPPSLASPADAAVDQPLSLDLSWNTSICANTYDIQVALDAGFASLVANASNLTVTSISLGGLSLYTQYYWRVRSVRGGVPGNWSAARWFRTIPPPPAAPALSAPLNGAVGQPLASTISCLTTTYAASYRFQVSTSPTFATVMMDQTQPGVSLALGGLSNFTTYYWRVQASNVSGLGPWSETWSFRTIVGAPQLVAPPVGSQGLAIPLVLQWLPATGATSYEAQLSEDPNFITGVIITNSTATTSVVSGLQNNTQIFWRVRAYSSATEMSAWSPVWNFSTIVGIPSLVAPLDGLTDIQPTGITARWNAVYGKAVYRVQVSPDILFKTITFEKANIDSISAALTGLQPNTLYYWRVQASNPATGTGSWSNPYTFRTIVGRVTGVAPANASKGVKLPVTIQWSQAGEGVVYRVQIASDAKFAKLVVDEEKVGVNNAAYGANAGLNNYTMYYWRVQPIALSGADVPWSPVLNFTTILGVPALVSPANNAANQKIETMLTWKATPGAATYSVRVYEHDNMQVPVFEDNAVTGASVMATGLKPEMTYHWMVQATDADGNMGDWSATWKFSTTMVAAAVPALDKPANNATDATADTKLEWKAAEYAQTYDVQVSTSSNFSSTIVNLTGVADVSLQVTGLASNQRYFWRVRAVNAAGASSWSETWTFVVSPLAPVAVALASPPNGADNQEYTVALRWNEAAGAETYQVQVSESNAFAATVLDKAGLPVSAYPASGLKEKTTYYWRVRAKNSTGDGAWSDVWSFGTKQAPSSVGEEILAAGAQLGEAYPNPVSGVASLGFTLGKPAVVTLTIVNNLGETAATLGAGEFAAGDHTFSWDASDVPAGVYAVRLTIGKSSVVRLLNVVK